MMSRMRPDGLKTDMLAMRSQGLKKPCAQWALVRPSAVPELLQHLISVFGDDWADGLANGPLLTKEQVQKVEPLMSSADFKVLYQKPGDMITVPCGWLHQVVNMQSCVKIACDVSNPDNLVFSLASWKLVSSGIMATGVNMPRITADYVCAAAAVVKAFIWW